jgi:predicted dehydrogenase
MAQSLTAKIRVAMIGCGRMGRHHSEKLILDGRGQVVALFDAEQSTAERLRHEFWPSATISTSFPDLLAKTGIDAAIVCTPTAAHHAQAKSALRLGWHVLCEKPLASDRSQILELIELATAARLADQAFSLGYQRRYTSLFRTMRREVFSGRWGHVRAITSNSVEHWQSTIAGTWRDDPQQNPGGFVTDAGSHKIDALFYLTGLKPVEVYARSQKWDSNVEVVTNVSALLTEDVSVSMNFVGLAQYLGEDLHLHCEFGDLMLRHDHLVLGREGRLEPLVADEPESDPVAGWLDTIVDHEADRSPPEAALPVYDMTQAILSSSRSGKSVRLM